jgi:glycosyltransferase involved in cell wall biosynthesis
MLDRSKGVALRILGLADGEPRDPRTASGIPSRLFAAREQRGYLAGAISFRPSSFADKLTRLRSFAPTKSAWRSRYRLSMHMVGAYEAAAKRRLSEVPSDRYDALLQHGANCNVWHAVGKPTFSYNDNDVLTMVLTDPRMRMTPRQARYVRARVAYEKGVFDTAERIFTFSEWCAARIAENYDVPREKLECVGAGSNIDPALLAGERDYDARHAVFIGVDFVRKGGPDLLEAFALVRKRSPEARLTIVGGAPRGELGPGIFSHGIYRGEENLAAILRSASLFVMPSVWEPFGVVFLEAMAAGLPCIGANLCAMPEIIGDGGSVVPPNDPVSLARTICEYLDPSIAAQRGAAAKARYHANYGWDKAARRIGVAVERTLGTAHRPAQASITSLISTG